MRKYICCFCLILFTNLAYAEVLSGRVVGVSDGDTITVLDSGNNQHKIRLSGIDAPEKKQAFGNASKRSLSNMIFNEQVQIDWNKEDRYGRKVGKVIYSEKDINLEQVKLGMAWYFKKYKGELSQTDRISYFQAQQNAKSNKIGLWLENQPIAPWDYRKLSIKEHQNK